MTFTRKMDGKTLEIAVEGKLDTLTAPQLAEDIKNGLDGAEFLIWDFENLEYISSAGFRVLLVAQNMLEDPDKMKVAHANEMVRTAFILTGQGSLLLDD
jgi:anti-sigma B factor antagonist